MISTKQRSFLKSMSNNMSPAFQIGKAGLTPEVTKAVIENLDANELIKLSVLKNCDEPVEEIAKILCERAHAQLVSTLGRKIVLYKESLDKDKKKIVLPRKKEI